MLGKHLPHHPGSEWHFHGVSMTLCTAFPEVTPKSSALAAPCTFAQRLH
jgi:hypothetical protein